MPKFLKHKKRLYALFFLLPLSCSNICMAESEAWRTVAAVSTGVAISENIGTNRTFSIVNPVTQEFFIYTTKQSTQTVPIWQGFIGKEKLFHPKWALQIGMAYAETWNFEAQGSLLQGADIPSSNQYSYEYNIKTRQLLAQGKLLYHCQPRFLPYLLFGFGIAFNEATNYETNVPPFLTFTREYANHNMPSFTYVAGFGIDTSIMDQLRLGIGYRFSDLGKVGLGNATIDTTSVPGTLSQSHLYTSELLAEVTYVF